jgi:mRNA interferase MazF
MADILRGEIHWADLNPTIGHEQSGHRPVLILSVDLFNRKSGTVIGMAMTSQEPRAGFPLTLELACPDLPKRSWVKISQIRTLSTERIGGRIGEVDAATLTHILEGLNELLGYPIM